MSDQTELETTAAGQERFEPIEQVSPDDAPEVLARKVEHVVRQLGDTVIEDALATGNLAVLTDREQLVALVGERIRFRPGDAASEQFAERVDQAVQQALASQADYLAIKGAAARLGAVFGAGRGFAIIADLAITALRWHAEAADPVSLATGQFTTETTDLRLAGAGIDFAFTRTYASHAFYDGPLGTSWDHSYNLWLRVEPGERRIVRSNGALREDLYQRHAQHDYWLPPDGEDGVIVREGERFVWRAPDGTRYIYAPDGGEPFLHQITRIEDRFGNHLAFAYAERSLRTIEVNHPRRLVMVDYDEGGRIAAVRDFTGRTWRYRYDGLGDLVTVTTPATAEHPGGLTTRYDYDSALRTGELRHNLVRITDPAGRTFLENTYGDVRGSLAFDRVVRQRQGGGETLFDYEEVLDAPADLADAERPVRQTVVTHRSGQMVRHVFNRFGNLLLREETGLIAGIPRLLRTHYRYNADGNPLASLTPEGVMTQYLYGREDFARRHPGEGPGTRHPDLSARERQAFGRTLAVVRRARTFTLLDLDLSHTVWGDMFPDVIGGLGPDGEGGTRDVVTKYTYEPDYGQLLTQSQPRFTASADPARRDAATGEHERYAETLTRYVYEGPPGDPARHLVQVVRPAPTLPDGTPGAPVTETFRNPDGSPAYDERGRRLRQVDPRGTVTEHAYVPDDPADARSGHLRETVVDPGGLALRTAFEVDELGRVVAVTHPRASGDGRFVSRDVHNELDQVVESVGSEPFAHRVRRRYGCSGELERIERDLVDVDGTPEHGGAEITTFEHDEELRIVSESIGGLGGAAPPLVTRHCYDAAGRRVLTLLPNGTRVSYRYDGRGLPLAQTLGPGSDGAATSRLEYDGDGRVRRGISARGAVTSYRLDALGRVVERTDPLGHVTRSSYDKLGNVTCVRVFELRDDGYHLLARSESRYDELDRLVADGVNRFDEDLGPLGREQLAAAHLVSPGPGRLLLRQRFHDAGGNVTRELDELGRETRHEFDAAGRPRVTVDPLGNETRSVLDAHGNVVRSDRVELVRDADGAITRRRTFSTVFVHDELDRLVETVDGLGNRTRYGYDSRDNRALRIDPLGHAVRLRFDAFNRRVAAIAEAATTSFEFDANGNAVAVVDPLGNRTEQRFDALNRRVAIVGPDASESRFEWDAGGNLTRVVDANGSERRFTVDLRNRVVAVEVSGGQGETFEAFEYDALDRCRLARNDFATSAYAYNSLGWALRETVSYTTAVAPLARELTIRREFDDAGAVSAVEYPGGRRIRLLRDALDRLAVVRNEANGDDYPGSALRDRYELATMRYAGLQRGTCGLANGSRSAYAYDAAGRVIEIAHQGPGGPLLAMQYAYDGAGDMRLRSDFRPGVSAGDRFRYDSLHRLVDHASVQATPFAAADFAPPADPPASIPDRQQAIDALLEDGQAPAPPATFDYDPDGNRLLERRSDGDVAYAVNELDQYVSRADADFDYDANGNLIADGRRRYHYDAQDRLARVEDAGTGATIARYQHDVRGRRVLEIEGGIATHLLWDAANLVGEYRDGRLFAAYVFEDGVDRPLQVATGGAEAFYHCDLLGSVRALTDGAGEVVARYRYGPFGTELEATGSVHNPLRHDGRRRSPALGTYDHRAREYDPRLGRYLQRDPAGMVESTNLYTFAENAPLTATDPWGTESRSEVLEDPIDSYLEQQREALDRRAGRYPQDEKYQQAFEMYGLVLDEIERSARTGRPVDLNGLWRKARRWNWDWDSRAWMHLCSKCYENPSFADVGPLPSQYVLGVDTVAVFDAATGDAKPNPSWGERLFQEAVLATLVFGPGLLGGSIRGSVGGTVARTATRTTVAAEYGALEARAALAAEAAGGSRVWLVGRGGAATTRGLRFSGNRITYDTLAPAASTKVRQDMGAISNIMGLRGPGFFRQGTWWTGTHGTPQGAFGGRHLELKFLRTDRQIGRYYNWRAETVYNRSEASILTSGLERPTVYGWCYSTSCFTVPKL